MYPSLATSFNQNVVLADTSYKLGYSFIYLLLTYSPSIKITVLIFLMKKMNNEAIRGVYYLRIREKTTRNDLQRRFSAQHIITTLLRNCVETLFQHCTAVLRKKSSLRIVPCNITLKVSNVIVAETSYQTIRSFIILLSGEGLTSFSINNFLVEKSKVKLFGVLFFF